MHYMECVVLMPAKLNLTLHVTGAEGGFHMLDSVVTTVEICDEVRVRLRRDGRVSAEVRGEGLDGLPADKNNACTAARMFCEKFGTCGVDIRITKRIPVGAGLGGSSADAAGVLLALCRLHGIPPESVCDIADKTGSDTRYMLTGGWARMSGRGNEVEPLFCGFSPCFLIAVPPFGVSAAECYKNYDRLGCRDIPPPRAEEALKCYGSLCGALHNALYAPAADLHPGIAALRGELLAISGNACMTGSGSAVFSVFDDMDACMRAQRACGGKYRTFAVRACLPQTR